MSSKNIGVALLGTGRMAEVYGPKINAHHGLALEVIYNPKMTSASKAVDRFGGRAMDDLDAVLKDEKVDAVIIATPTTTHVEYIEAAAKAGKPIYCEKPLDQNLARCDEALTALSKSPVPFMLGFNRRFDPDNSALRNQVANGHVGTLNMLMSTSREPAPPPMDYVERSGGYFVDASIHDIDLLCWIAGELPSEVSAFGSCVFNPDIGKSGDFDLTMTTLKFPSGLLAHINNSRQCIYGFDQRVEAFGTKGMVQTQNHREDNLIRWNGEQTEGRAICENFFLERYDASFGIALDEFYNALCEDREPSSTAQDGRNALAIALACAESANTGKAVSPKY